MITAELYLLSLKSHVNTQPYLECVGPEALNQSRTESQISGMRERSQSNL
jgi:hypothetical protein